MNNLPRSLSQELLNESEQLLEEIDRILTQSDQSPTHTLSQLVQTVFRRPRGNSQFFANSIVERGSTPLVANANEESNQDGNANASSSIFSSLFSNPSSNDPVHEISEVEQLLRHFTFALTSPSRTPTHALSPSSSVPTTPRARSRLIDPHRRYSSEEYSFARDEFKKLAESPEARQSEVSTKILNAMIDFYYDHDCEEWPLQQDIVQRVREMPCGCIFTFTGRVTQSCFQMYDEEESIEMLYYYLFSKARVPRCEEIRPILEYHTLMSEYPSHDQLQEYIMNTFSFYSNPEEYHQQDKMHVPVSHPERIPVIGHTGEPIGCGICQCDIVEPQDKIQLPKCSHSFHAHSSDCLESASIYTWFQSESTCPLCKEKV